MMSIDDLMVIVVETPKIDSGCFLKKYFIKYICMNLRTILYLIINQVYSFHDYVHGPSN